MKCVAMIFLMMFTLGKQVFASPVIWNEGTIVLQNEEVITGDLSVDAKHDVVLMRNGDRVDVLAAHRIQSVFYFDQFQNINRRFVAMKSSGFKHWSLYEVVLSGDVSILRKLKTTSGKSTSDADDFSYFTSHNNSITPLRSFRSAVYPHLLDVAGNQLTDYVKTNRLNPNHEANAIVIVERFNHLAKVGILTDLLTAN